MEGYNQKHGESIEQKQERIRDYIALAEQLIKNNEKFPFPGIKEDFYESRKKSDEEFSDKEAYGYTTPIDTLIERFKEEGIKVAFSKYRESGNVFILPATSNDIEMDGIRPENLNITDDMDGLLKKLILTNQNEPQ